MLKFWGNVASEPSYLSLDIVALCFGAELNGHIWVDWTGLVHMFQSSEDICPLGDQWIGFHVGWRDR